MSKEDWSSIKINLLRSGIPLEVSTWRKLSGMGYTEIGDGEYTYLRDEEPMSIDIHGIKFLDTPINSFQGHIDLLVECKYKEQNKHWYFFKFDKSFLFGIGRANPTNMFIDFPLKSVIWKYHKYRNNFVRDYVSKAIQEFIMYPKGNDDFLPIASKGTELIDKSKNKKNNISESKKYDESKYSINHALGQLRYGSASLLLQNYSFYSKGLFKNHLYSLIIPVLVTTSKLYFQNTSLSLEEMKKSDKIDEIFKEVDYLIYHVPPDEQLKNYIKKDNDFKDIKKHFAYPERYITNGPNCFYVVNYEKLDEFMVKLENHIQTSIENILKNYPEVVEKMNRKYF